MDDKTIQTVSINLNLPQDLLGILRKSRSEMEKVIYHWIALELFREKRISAGKAAELAHIDISEFMDLTRRQKIEWVSYTEEELDKEISEALTLDDSK